ncbi:hypothetical protein [Chryseobacterium sp.]|uniref:hypothetical protein n=1 Tax=Chryseobacterium sp. TaxID=1871047 RepID=UPI0011CBE9DF|nr:hypothetical protein [Chryseobacterium sp.]TXF77219.1 hypothetical protein FUA25_04575 [Chryseobacterium sp.]
MKTTKPLLLVMHNFVGLGEMMVKNLQYLQVDADVLFYGDATPFRYANLGQKVKSFVLKKFFNNKNYKRNLQEQHRTESLMLSLSKLGTYENILVINAEYFETHFIAELSKHTENLTGYHWDGLKRNPEIAEKIALFSRFFVFDKADADEEKNIFFLPNFYFDYPEDYKKNHVNYDVLYIGTYMQERFSKLLAIRDSLRKIHLKSKILLISFDKKISKQHSSEGIEFSSQIIDYPENLELVKQSKTLLDLKLKDHNGLSFRFFEALKYEKKIITDNESVMNYPFYRPENIFILGLDPSSELERFISSPYEPISESIRKEYSFSNWYYTITSASL